MNCAPASAASMHFSNDKIVPAPTSISGTDVRTSLIASMPAAVRMVISMMSNPPANSARAAGTASSTLSMTTTGTSPAFPILSITFISTSFVIHFK